MAKIKYPLFSAEVRGTIFGKLTFSKKSIGQECRNQNAQVDFDTPNRLYARGVFRTATQWWNVLTSAEQLEFVGYTKDDI